MLSELFPFLTHTEQLLFSRVNKTMREWVELAAKVHFQRHHIEDKEMKRFFHFTKSCKHHLTRKMMFDRYKELRERARKRVPRQLPVSRASMSVLVFYLYNNNRRALEHLVHCSRSFCPEVRRTFLRVWLRVQLYCSRYSINKASNSSVAFDNMNKSSNYNKSNSVLKKRLRGAVAQRAGKRQRTPVKRFVPECKSFLDDKSEEEEEEVDLSNDEGVEERSSDSDSEGSLCDFIVKDDASDVEDEESENSYDSCANENELSDNETSCTSDYSVYSD